MIEPTARQLQQIGQQIDAAHQEIDAETPIDITFYIDSVGRPYTFDHEAVVRLAARAKQAIRSSAEAEEQRDSALRSAWGWRMAACIMAAVLLLHIVFGGRP